MSRAQKNDRTIRKPRVANLATGVSVRIDVPGHNTFVTEAIGDMKAAYERTLSRSWEDHERITGRPVSAEYTWRPAFISSECKTVTPHPEHDVIASRLDMIDENALHLVLGAIRFVKNELSADERKAFLAEYTEHAKGLGWYDAAIKPRIRKLERARVQRVQRVQRNKRRAA